jgi:hypothetical protein
MSDESKIFGVSVRAFVTLYITMTVCMLSIFDVKIVEPLYSAFLLCLGFYFGQKNQTTGVKV